MASQSAHFNLTKPATTDNYDIAVFNGNTDIIDTQMYNNQQNAAKVMVGATPQADGESGRVPAPAAGDEDKYLKANGTWDTPSGGGGSSTLSGLTDTDITTPSNGQVLTYDPTSQKWVNADPGEITRGYTLTTISDGTVVQNVITLSQPYTKYDEIIFTWQYNNNLYIMSQKETVSGLSIGDTILLDDYQDRGITFEVTSATELTITAQDSNIAVISIRGVTYSQQAKEESRDILWTSGAWTLAHPITDYDEIVFKYGNKSTGMIPSDVIAYSSFIILNGSTNNFYWFDVTDASTFTTHQDYNLVITSIEGVKYTRVKDISDLDDLTDVDISSPTNGQVLKYNSTTQKWENADDGGSSQQKRYLGELIPRVSGADNHISASSEGSYGSTTWYAWGAFSSIQIGSDWGVPPSGSAWVDASDSNPTIQYHFDSPRYFTQLAIDCGSNYSSPYIGTIYIEASNDGTTWTDIGSGAQTINAPYHSISTNTYTLDDTDTWEYIRIRGAQSFFILNSPSCFIQRIQAYGGDVINGIDASIIDFSTLTSAQITQLQTLLGIS